MRKVGFVTAIVLTMLTVALLAYLCITALVDSIYRYASPLKGTPPQTEDSSRPLTSQVVLLVVDGLRFDASLQMPYLETLRRQGAHAMLVARQATGSITSWTTLLSGARPEINGAPLFDPLYEGIQPISTDNLFAAVNRSGLTNGIAASRDWERLIPADLLYTQYFADGDDEAADRSIMDRCLMFLSEFRPNFMLVHLSQVNTVGLQYGAQRAGIGVVPAGIGRHALLIDLIVDLPSGKPVALLPLAAALALGILMIVAGWALFGRKRQ